MQDGHRIDRDWNGRVTIKQSWSRISVTLRTSQSESVSKGASLYEHTDDRYRLVYHYDNDPHDRNDAELKPHSGLCELIFDKASKTASGTYFNGGRNTSGVMHLLKEK